MILLLTAILCNGVFGQSYKYAVARDQDVDWVSLLSFAFSAVLISPLLALRHGGPTWIAVGFGAAFGLASGLSQITFFRTLRYGPLSTSYTILALNTLIPALASIVLWSEQPGVWQIVAMVVAVVAVLLMGDVEFHSLDRPMAWAGWLALTFVTSGLAGICMRAAGALPGDRTRPLFLLVGYAMSGILTIPLVRGRRPGKPEMAVSAIRALAIVSANLLLLGALAVLPGYITFSAYGSGIVIVNVIAAMILWRERPRGLAILGIVLGIAAVVLFNV